MRGMKRGREEGAVEVAFQSGEEPGVVVIEVGAHSHS